MKKRLCSCEETANRAAPGMILLNEEYDQKWKDTAHREGYSECRDGKDIRLTTLIASGFLRSEADTKHRSHHLHQAMVNIKIAYTASRNIAFWS